MAACFKKEKECTGQLVFLFLMTSIIRMAEECDGHLVFLVLITGCFKKDKECTGHLVFMLFMTGSVKEDKECAGHLVFPLFLISYRSCRHCILNKFFNNNSTSNMSLFKNSLCDMSKVYTGYKQ